MEESSGQAVQFEVYRILAHYPLEKTASDIIPETFYSALHV